MFQTEEVEILKMKLKVLEVAFNHSREEDSHEVEIEKYDVILMEILDICLGIVQEIKI